MLRITCYTNTTVFFLIITCPQIATRNNTSLNNHWGNLHFKPILTFYFKILKHRKRLMTTKVGQNNKGQKWIAHSFRKNNCLHMQSIHQCVAGFPAWYEIVIYTSQVSCCRLLKTKKSHLFQNCYCAQKELPFFCFLSLRLWNSLNGIEGSRP